MSNEEWVVMLQLIPTAQHNQLVLVLKSGTELSVDLIFRYEPTFLVMRGRVSGNVDEGRAFFIPYDQMLYLRLERIVKLEELAALFGETLAARVSPLDASAEPAASATIVQPTAGPAVDPATIARNALLDRIRAARASTGGPVRNGPPS